MTEELPAPIAALPPQVRNLIRKQCGDDWRRVVIDERGGVTVHNRPHPQSVAAELKKAATTTVAKRVTKQVVKRQPLRPRTTLPIPPRGPSSDLQDALDAALERARARRAERVQRPRRPAPPRVEAPPAVEPPEAPPEPPSLVETPEPEAPPVHPAELLRRRTPTPPPARPPAWTQPPAPSPKPSPDMFRRTVLDPVRPKHLDRPVAPAVAAQRAGLEQVHDPLTSQGPAILDLPKDDDGPSKELERQDDSGRRWILLPGIEGWQDWDGANLEGTAHKVWLATREGIPAQAPMLFHGDVTALYEVDLDQVESVCRHPDRVEIAPETYVKKYPVLKYWRGDVMVVVGFREPATPKIIAAYVGGMRLADWHRRNTQGKAGGGGARKTVGLPRNATQLINRIQGLGAVVEDDGNDKTHTVKFLNEEGKLQTLGKIDTRDRQKATDVGNSYQRVQRQIQAIVMRKAKTG